jgi:hypothetical protein
VITHDRKIEEMNCSASLVQNWYKTNMRRIVEEKERRDTMKLLHENSVKAVAAAALRQEAASVLQTFLQCAAANRSYRQQLLYIIRWEALAARRDAAWSTLKGFSLIIRAKRTATQLRQRHRLLLFKNDPNKASRVISRAVRRRAGQLMRLHWLTVGRFALATARLQHMRFRTSAAALQPPKTTAVSNENDADAPLRAEVLEDMLMQMELTLRTQDEERSRHSIQITGDSEVAVGSTPAPAAVHVAPSASHGPAAQVQRCDMKAKAAAAAPNSRLTSRSRHASAPAPLTSSASAPAPLTSAAPSATSRASRAIKNAAQSGAISAPLPVGSVVFSIRQLSEKHPALKSSKRSIAPWRAAQHRSAFAQASELFSSSPSRSSSSAIALKQAEAARTSALNGVQSALSQPNCAQTSGYGLEDDGDESSGQLPIGVLEALMVRPTRAAEQDRRLLKLALETDNMYASVSMNLAAATDYSKQAVVGVTAPAAAAARATLVSCGLCRARRRVSQKE